MLEIGIGFSPGRSAPKVPDESSFTVHGSSADFGNSIFPVVANVVPDARITDRSMAMTFEPRSRWKPPSNESTSSGS